MKKHIHLIVGIIVGIMLFGVVQAVANNGTKTISVLYNNIKISLNGKEVKTDAEPFIFEGRTFVPVRFVSEALGADVKFNPKTNTVEITRETSPATTPPPPSDPVNSMTIGQKNALGSAKSYLSFSAFSYTGLIKQLEFEKYSHADAVFAADNCGANWFEQAAKSAKSYLSFATFSREGLIKQLEYEGFTHEQAVYGVEANGY